MNTLFFASLALILILFISMLAKGWFHGFDPGFAPIPKPYNRAVVREYRYLCLERWKNFPSSSAYPSPDFSVGHHYSLLTSMQFVFVLGVLFSCYYDCYYYFDGAAF